MGAVQRAVLLWLGLALLNAPESLAAAGKDKPMVVAGRLRSPLGTMLQADGQGWKTPALYDPVFVGDLLVALPGARGVLEVREGDVGLTLLGSLFELSPVPLLESAVRLHDPGEDDLALTLERGRVLVENHKDKEASALRLKLGAAEVKVRLLDKAALALESYSFYPAGTPFSPKDKNPPGPRREGYLLLVKGKAEIEMQGEKRSVQAPIVYRWSGGAGLEGPFPLNKSPDWLHPGKNASAKAIALYAAVEKLRRSLGERPVDKALQDALRGDDANLHGVALASAAAVDDLGVLLAGLNDSRHQAARGQAVLALRYWLARGPRQARTLYETLHRSATPVQAEIVLHLLLGFSETDRARPETYGVLISYLQNDALAIRELAAWNLYRMVPAGAKIAYNAAAPEAERLQAQHAWRALIPEGKLPPAEKKTPPP